MNLPWETIMFTKKLLIPAIVLIALSAPATVMADNSNTAELAEPLIKLMPALKKIRAELNLNEKQNTVIKSWMTQAPAKKAELKQKVVAARAELREALLNRDSRIARDDLKKNLALANRKVIEMQSLCARMLYTTLTKQQYAKVVAQFKKDRQS